MTNNLSHCLSDLIKVRVVQAKLLTVTIGGYTSGRIVPENNPLDETAKLLLLVDASEVKGDDSELEIMV